jgi:hypothetical protein
VLRAAGETETTQENIQNLLHVDEGYPRFQFSNRGRNCYSDIFLFIFISIMYAIKISIYLFPKFFVFWAYFFIFYYYYWWGGTESLGICSSP